MFPPFFVDKSAHPRRSALLLNVRTLSCRTVNRLGQNKQTVRIRVILVVRQEALLHVHVKALAHATLPRDEIDFAGCIKKVFDHLGFVYVKCTCKLWQIICTRINGVKSVVWILKFILSRSKKTSAIMSAVSMIC